MKYVLKYDDQFWTGDRWSDHVGEAMGYTLRVARGKVEEIKDHQGIKPKIVEKDSLLARRSFYDY